MTQSLTPELHSLLFEGERELKNLKLFLGPNGRKDRATLDKEIAKAISAAQAEDRCLEAPISARKPGPLA